MKRYFGNYIGIVINDNDPEFRNRIQVYIPSVSVSLLSKFNNKRKNFIISQLGNNIKNSLTDDVVQDLQRILPWAECAAPLFGGGTSLHYNPETKKSTNKNNIGLLNSTDITTLSEEEQTEEQTEEQESQENINIHPDLSPADISQISVYGVNRDAFSGSNNQKKIVSDILNENTYELSPTFSTIMPGGLFSTPKINSHVWVFFNEGDPQYPIYFAHHIVPEDWHRVNQNTTEIKSLSSTEDFTYTLNPSTVKISSLQTEITASPPSKINLNNKYFRNSISTISQPNAGMIEFITLQSSNTATRLLEDYSGIKISTNSGNMISLLAGGNIEYAPVNKTVKVAGNSFTTIEGYSESLIKSSQTVNIQENATYIVGDISPESLSAANTIYNTVSANYLEYIKNNENNVQSKISCPICYSKTLIDSGAYIVANNLRKERSKLNLQGRDSVGIRAVLGILDIVSIPIEEVLIKDLRKSPSCGNPMCQGNLIPDYNNTREIDEKYKTSQISTQQTILSAENNLGIGGNLTNIISKNSFTKIGSIINSLEPYAQLKNAYPIKNGVEFISKKGIVPRGDAVDVYKSFDVPGPAIGYSEVVVGTRYELTVGARGICIQTIGDIDITGGVVNITGNTINLNNNKGTTKITGDAVIIESNKSITLGSTPTNVHVNGSIHSSANLTTQGSIFANGTLYAKRLVMPSSIQRTDTSSIPDETTSVPLWGSLASTAFTSSLKIKDKKYYNQEVHGQYASTELGMSDIALDWVTTAQLSADVSGSTPTGVTLNALGASITFNKAHIHSLNSMAHEHSFKGPEGFYLNHPDEMYEIASATGTAIPDII